jgi:hypothetical protein
MDKRYYWKCDLRSQSFSFPVYFIVKQNQLKIKYIKINQLVYLLCSTWCTKGRFWANNSVWCSVWLPYCNKREVELKISLSTGIKMFVTLPVMCVAYLGRCCCCWRLYSSHTASTDSENLIIFNRLSICIAMWQFFLRTLSVSASFLFLLALHHYSPSLCFIVSSVTHRTAFFETLFSPRSKDLL